MKVFSKVLYFVALCFLIFICFKLFTPIFQSDHDNKNTPLDEQAVQIDLNDPEKVIAVEVGTLTEAAAKKKFPKAEFIAVSDLTNGFLAVTGKKADAFATDKLSLEKYCEAGHKDLVIHNNEVIGDKSKTSIGVSRSGRVEKPLEKVNNFIADIEKNGILSDMKKRWLVDSNYKMPNIPEPKSPDHTLRIGTTGLSEPYSFFIGNQLSGLDVEIMRRFALWDNAKLEILTYDWAGLITACIAGKVDYIISNLMETQERREKIDFSDPYSYLEPVIVVPSASHLSNIADTSNIYERIKNSFVKTFIRENRWRLILQGLLVTLSITIFAGLFGSILGIILCVLMRSKFRFIALITKGLMNIMQGIPSVVILMIVNFIIFGSIEVPPVIVGIIAFSIIFAFTAAHVLDTGIKTIDKGQWEAALSLGFSHRQTFSKIIMPQAILNVLSIYKGELVSMMKLTSITGYISIQDLTKAGDIIRSRTYDAFFPLVSTAVIYFLLSYFLTSILNFIEKKFDYKKKKRILPKGINPGAQKTFDENVNNSSKVSKGEAVIEISHVKKQYLNAFPLKDVNAEIKRGEVITIIGPSGTGKSTLLRCINHLENPTSGTIKVLGHELNTDESVLQKIRSQMGMVFQSFNLFGHLNVIENIMLAPTLLKHKNLQQAYDDAINLLRTVGLSEKALNYPDELSGGQKQRIAIVRALAMDPEIVLFDEPTSALDPNMVGEVLSVIRTLAKKGLTMMIVTHEMKFAKDVSSRIFYMDQGIIYEDGSPEKIFEHPEKDLTRQFIKRLKVLELTISSKDYDFISIMNKMETFGHTHFMNQKAIMRMQRVFEEISTQLFTSDNKDSIKMFVTVEYSEESGLNEMTFKYNGKIFDPKENGSKLSAAFIKMDCISYEYHTLKDEFTNEIKLTLKK